MLYISLDETEAVKNLMCDKLAKAFANNVSIYFGLLTNYACAGQQCEVWLNDMNANSVFGALADAAHLPVQLPLYHFVASVNLLLDLVNVEGLSARLHLDQVAQQVLLRLGYNFVLHFR